jgi:hypothetical protein
MTADCASIYSTTKNVGSASLPVLPVKSRLATRPSVLPHTQFREAYCKILFACATVWILSRASVGFSDDQGPIL